MRLLITALLYFAVMDGFVYLLTGESLHHAAMRDPHARIGSPEYLEAQDRAEWERQQDLRRKYASAGEAGTATTVQQGVVHEHATGKAGDAQGGSRDSTT